MYYLAIILFLLLSACNSPVGFVHGEPISWAEIAQNPELAHAVAQEAK